MGTISLVEKAAEPASARLILAIVGLDQGHDGADIVTRVLESVPGVARAYFNGDTEMAYVEYRESAVTLSSVLAALEHAGLSVGDVTVRSTTQGEVLPCLAGGAARNDARTKVAVEELGIDAHSCCGTETLPDKVARAAAVEAYELPTANDARRVVVHDRDHLSRPQAQQGWPFRVRLALFLAAVVLVLGPALWLVRPMSSNAMGADYSINMSMTGFTPPNFTMPAGKPVSLELNNVDSPFHGVINGALHQFAIDKLGIDVRLDGKQSTVIDLPALEPGTYEFYCNVCCGGKVNPSMRGTITVEGTEGMSQR